MQLKVYVMLGKGAIPAEEIAATLTAHGMGRSENLDSADFVMVVGDDRDVLDAIQVLGKRSTPILGVSSGGASYLTSTTVDDLGSALEALDKGEYEIAEYTKLEGIVDGETMLHALNEIAVFPSRSATLMSYELYVDGDLVWRDRADGVLAATPIGSTAYALSAGGAVVFEGAQVLELLPVNSIDPSKRPLIVPDSSLIEIKGISSKHPCEAIADGGTRARIKSSVEVRKADTPLRLVRIFSTPSVKETLKEKFPSDLLDMPPSAKFVLKILEIKGPMSVKELADETMLPERTVRYALSELLRRGLVRKVVTLRNARQTFYERTE